MASRVRIAGVIIAVLLGLSCSRVGLASSRPSPTPSISTSPSAATPSGPLLVGLWKGYVPSLKRSVFIAWVTPKSSSSDDFAASIGDVSHLIIPKLRGTAFSIFIVNVIIEESNGLLNVERQSGTIFLRDSRGRWSSLDGSGMSKEEKAAFVDRVLQAGLPQTPDVPGGQRVSAPLSAPKARP